MAVLCLQPPLGKVDVPKLACSISGVAKRAIRDWMNKVEKSKAILVTGHGGP
jgi:hypothetical protein